MSKKPWRNPANPDYKSPALDLSTQPAQPPQPQAQPKAQSELSAAMSDDEARGILVVGARVLHRFLALAHAAIIKIDPELMVDAAKGAPISEPQHASPQKRPRGSVHPLLVLARLVCAANGLLPRIMKLTHPHLFGKGGDAVRTAGGMENFMAQVKTAMDHLGYKPAAA